MTADTTTQDGLTQATEALQVLQRVVLPAQDDVDTMPLYVDFGRAQGVASADTHAMASTVTLESSDDNNDAVTGRRTLDVAAGRRVSFASYFNAFPASYWKRWTTLTDVVLRVQVQGEGVVVVSRSTARGAIQRVLSREVSGSDTVEVTLPLAKFGDGGWYWFDLVAGASSLQLVQADWIGVPLDREAGTATLEITTMNKPDYCLANIKALAGAPDVLARLDQVLIVDQGNKKVQEQPGFDEVAALFDGKLRIINQSNLGGSGGFARGMYESVRNESTWCLLMDDDIRLEPESILRMMTFSDYCKRPTIVGAHMFDLQNRSILHAFGEAIDRYRWHYTLAPGGGAMRHDLANQSLRNTPWLHRRLDVDYNGWWMDLIPTSVIKEIGLSLPVFIKWDDAEFGIRAQAAGIATVSLPGACVWHESWLDKDDLVGWQAYFHTRNRLISALLHSPYERGGRVVLETSNLTIKHLISMQYYTGTLRNRALEDLLRGPSALFDLLASRIGQVRGLASDFTDGAAKPEPDDFPAPRMVRPPRKGRGFAPPSPLKLLPWAARTALRHAVGKVAPEHMDRPQAQLAHMDNAWWRTSQYESVLVSNAEGTAVSWYQRNPELFRSEMARNVTLIAELYRRWPALKDEYQRAFRELVSMEAWGRVFDEHTESELVR